MADDEKELSQIALNLAEEFGGYEEAFGGLRESFNLCKLDLQRVINAIKNKNYNIALENLKSVRRIMNIIPQKLVPKRNEYVSIINSLEKSVARMAYA